MSDDHEAIRNLLVDYCQLCDDGRFDEWGQLFTDDATFTVMGTTHTGRGDVQAFITAAQPPEARGRHLISQPRLTIDGDSAEARTDYAFVGRTDRGRLAVTSSGRYLDRFVRDGGRWRFASREIVFLGDPLN
jgi:3-phenylpropionate/cinnamic acid dioxygenase small subunit